MTSWKVVKKFDKDACLIADGHYSRRKPGSPQFMPPGETLVLLAEKAVFGWWRPHPRSGIKSMNGLDGWTCSIFRNESKVLSSQLILEAELELIQAETAAPCGPDGLLTYVWDKKIKSVNPGYCFKCAGWGKHPDPKKRRSKDGRKTLLWKPISMAGLLERAA